MKQMKSLYGRVWRTVLPVLLVGCLSGCAYTHTQHPMSTEFDRTPLGTREGRASSYSLLWLVAWGDSGTHAAARNGGIQAIDFTDVEVKLVLFGLYTRVTTVAYGD